MRAAVTITDNSLAPRFKVGDTVMVDAQPAAIGDEVCVMTSRGRHLLGELLSRSDGLVAVLPPGEREWVMVNEKGAAVERVVARVRE